MNPSDTPLFCLNQIINLLSLCYSCHPHPLLKREMTHHAPFPVAR
ncbi:hypothetical protein BN1182_BH_00620 [Pantoea ananatis]|nr:hypothetical protein BN1182_BH_00620 [Pantoea ananatis]